MGEVKKDVTLAVTKFASEGKAAIAAKEQEVKGWWTAHKVWAAISLACGLAGFILAKIH